MRVIVLFDLPTFTSEDLREYRRFRKYLIKSGFMMLQESVYCKLALNQTAADYLYDRLRKNKPAKGSVIVFGLTEKQFSKAEYLVGGNITDIINCEERLLLL